MTQPRLTNSVRLRKETPKTADVGLPDAFATALQPILECLSDGICLAAPDPWRVVYANETLLSWLVSATDDWRGRPLEDLFPTLLSGDSRQQLNGVLKGDLTDNAPIFTSERPFWISSNRMLEAGTDFPSTLRICRVVMETEEFVAIIVHRTEPAISSADIVPVGRVDPLTGLPDRSFLLDRLAVLLESCRESDHQFAVLFLDLNNFKQVNDLHGHLVGDRMLCEVVRRLSASVRMGDHVVRYGGDEFVVLVEQVHNSSEVQPVVNRIRASLRTPFALPDGEVPLSASIGVAVAGPKYHTAEEILSAADKAMYESKRSGS